ncbi:MAG: hypothetical protein GY861_18045 [bacterium]|nr:hypothetical protein [bacterium]
MSLPKKLQERIEEIENHYGRNAKYGALAIVDELHAENQKLVETIAEHVAKRVELRDEIEILKEYQTHIFNYVQCTNNTSAKFLGWHIAEALVEDHKMQKADLRLAMEALEKWNRVSNDEKLLGCEPFWLKAMDDCAELTTKTLTILKKKYGQE